MILGLTGEARVLPSDDEAFGAWIDSAVDDAILGVNHHALGAADQRIPGANLR